MFININDKDYEVVILKKNIKNTYIRVKSDLKIYVTTNIFTSKSYIKDLILKNYDFIVKMIDKETKKNEKNSKFFYLGKEYSVILMKQIDKVTFDDKYVYTKDISSLNRFLEKEAKRVFKERLDIVYNNINNKSIPYPNLKIRKMKRKWGYNKKSDNLVCLNFDLIKYEVDDIDYVIVHELCHFLYFDHSKNFWNSVKLYKPNYKENKKHLKED